MANRHPILHPKVTTEMLLSVVQSDEQSGFCMYCGEQAEGVEPDAREYRCECCGNPAVYGAAELLFMFFA